MTILSGHGQLTRIDGTASRTLRYLPLSALVLDLAIVAAACVVGVLGRQHLGLFDTPRDVASSLTIVGPLLVLGWAALVAQLGGYRIDVFGAGTDEFKRVLNASMVAAGLLGVACYFAKFPLSRGFFLLAFTVGTPALLIGRLVLRRAVQQARRQGRLRYRVLIAGSPSHVDEIAAVLRREDWLGYEVVGALTPGHDRQLATYSGIPVVGGCDDATEIAKSSDVDVIFLAGGALSSSTQLRQIAWDLEQHHVQVVVAPSVTDVSAERVRVRPVGGLPLMHLDPPRSLDAARLGKRMFDLVGSALLLLAFGPLLLALALRIRIHDGGPALFKQTRIGRDGNEFTCLKFRTMVMDAEARIAELQDEHGQTALLFKLKDDPRITRPGHWLRRFSLDELPQLINVLRGDMSLVGPRPQVEREVALYEGPMSRRLRVKPGMTGLWQVSGRNDLSIQDAVRLDLYYVDNWSMVQDVNILLKTVGAVFGSRGAY